MNTEKDLKATLHTNNGFKKGGPWLEGFLYHTIELCCEKKEEKVGGGSDAYVVLGGLTGLELGITQTSVNSDVPEPKRRDSHKPATPACREKDLPSCIGDIILMVNLAK